MALTTLFARVLLYVARFAATRLSEGLVKASIPRRLPLEGPTSVFFPQRLKMACTLSFWIAFMLSLVVINLLVWLRAAINFAGPLKHTLDQIAGITDPVVDADGMAAFLGSCQLHHVG